VSSLIPVDIQFPAGLRIRGVFTHPGGLPVTNLFTHPNVPPVQIQFLGVFMLPIGFLVPRCFHSFKGASGDKVSSLISVLLGVFTHPSGVPSTRRLHSSKWGSSYKVSSLNSVGLKLCIFIHPNVLILKLLDIHTHPSEILASVLSSLIPECGSNFFLFSSVQRSANSRGPSPIQEYPHSSIILWVPDRVPPWVLPKSRDSRNQFWRGVYLAVC
jgi:hypothetical protein